MTQITATELKANLGNYLKLVAREDIVITKNGTSVAVLTAPKQKRNWIDEIAGTIQNANIDEKQLKAERLVEKHGGLD